MSTVSYLPILLFVVIALVFPVVTLALARVIRPHEPDPVKLSAYECGIEATSEARGRSSVHFYVIAVLFVVFDVETIFLFPWAVRYRMLGWFGLVEMAVFLLILLVAYAYAWTKGALKWA